ncbi:MAG: cell division protein FtsZ [Nitrososphaerales archaeon]
MLRGDGLGVEIQIPMTIVGVGGAGARLAAQARAKLGAKCILISNDRNDLNHPDCEGISIDVKQLLNPSPNSIRGAVLESQDSIMDKLKDSSTVIVIGNLAGKAGIAITPLITRMAKRLKKNVISFAIMPFKFETNKLFSAGVSLKRVKESSDCLVIVDNDALLFNNPDLTPQDCYRITNDALLEVMASVANGIQLDDETNVLCTSRDSVDDAESALKDSIKMLYSNVDPENVKRAMLYVIGGDRVPVGVLNTLVNSVHNILGENGTEVGLSLSSSGSKGVKVLLMASVLEQTRFDGYDPLNMLPADSVMDWDEIECDLKIEMSIPRMD